MTDLEAMKEVMREVIQVAADLGKAERERLGRDLTEAEAARLAKTVRQQFEVALTMAKVSK